MKKRNAILIGAGIILILFMGFLAFSFFTKDTESEATIRFEDISDFNGCTIGSQTGTIFDQYIERVIENPEFLYYDDISSSLLALKNGKVDAIGLDEPVAKLAEAQNPDLVIFPQVIQIDTYGFVFPKSSDLTDDFSTIINKYTEDGTLEKLKKKWFSGDSKSMRIDMSEYSGYDTSNGEIHFYHDTTQIPMSYVDSTGHSAGYEVELLLMIAKELGKKVTLTNVNFSSLITAVSTGKADVSAGCISISDERREIVDFADTHYQGGIILLCRGEDIGITSAEDNTDLSFTEKLSQSFYRTFIVENRYKLILSGLGITVLISLCALIFGSVLGFGICLLRRSKNILTAKITAGFIRIIQGIPLVVLLLILYYVVFASTDLSGCIVAIIAFSLNFGVNSAEIMRTGINGINQSQWDISASLGLSKRQTFSKIIMPQAIANFMPAFKCEFINMMKMTSVVGFIAVVDLTKASDIIRSHTYESLFPLIVVALFYFLLAWILTELIGLAEIQLKHRHYKIVAIPDDVFYEPFSGMHTNTSFFEKEIIRFEDIKKVFPDITPLININASINGGDTVSIIGPSGTGKTTLLKMINHMQTPTEGKVFVFGKDMDDKYACQEAQKKIGMLFQNSDLFPHLSIVENIMLAPMCVLKKSKQDAYNLAIELLKSVSMADKANALPNELSGGQKQRVAIAQTLAMEPEIILFDEPTSALDPTMVSEVLSVIRSLSKHKLTMIIVTHEMRFAEAVSSKVFYMDEGIIYESGTPEEIFKHPQKENTRRFIRRLRTCEASITSRNFDFIGLNSEFEAFAAKHMLSEKTVYDFRVILEELCLQTVMPKLPEKPFLNILAEYSEESSKIHMILRYNGEAFDPTVIEDTIPMQLVKNAVRDISYKFLPEEEAGNQIEILI